MSELPASILEDIEHEVIIEDAMLELFRRRLPDLRFTSLIEQDSPAPFVLIRKVAPNSFGLWDYRFLETYYFSAEVFASGLDADVDAPRIILAMRNALTRAALDHDPVLEGLGWIQSGRVVGDAVRRADYANSEGPVQYADLPQEWVRYTATFRVQIKRAHVGPNLFTS